LRGTTIDGALLYQNACAAAVSSAAATVDRSALVPS
jgi:hypothetical protein